LSILSGSHLELVRAIAASLHAGRVDAPVVVGGIIPEEDHAELRALGVAAIFTPKDYELVRIVDSLADLVLAHRARGGG
jgi:(2R)-ethylmalonyl-CoA mutase